MNPYRIERARWREALGPGAVAAAAGLALALVLALRHGVRPGLPLDDAWIHAAFARHVARHGQWGLFTGDASGGESSLLWPLLLAPGELLGAARAPLLALLLGSVGWLLLPGCVGAAATSPRRGWTLAVCVGLCGPLLFLAVSGMETIGALALGMGALVLAVRGRLRVAGLAAAAGTALRPDGVLVLLPVLVAGVIHRLDVEEDARDTFAVPGDARREAWRQTWRALVPGVIASAAAILLLGMLEGRIPPATLGGRRWIVGLPVALDPLGSVHRLPEFLMAWVRAITADLGWGRVATQHPFPGVLLVRWAWKLAVVIALPCGVVSVLRQHREEPLRGRLALLLALWTLLVLLFYALVLPARGHLGRYQPQVFLLFVLLAVDGVGLLLRRGSQSRALGWACGIVLAAGLVAGWLNAARLWGRAVETLDRVHLQAAKDLPALLPPAARVAAFDVGVLAYFHDGALVDLSGLSDPEIAAALPGGDLAPLLQKRGATHLLLPEMGAQGPQSLAARLGLLPHGGFALEPLGAWEAPEGVWGEAFAFSGNVFPRLELFRIRYSGGP
jgi:hypothetical protein